MNEELKNLIGLTEEEVGNKYSKVRVVNEDGKPFIVTRDYNPNRVNLVISLGKVVDAHFG